MKFLRRLDWRGPPLALQIMALLLAGLVVAQLVTLFLTLLLPPAPAPQYGLDAIAAALTDQSEEGNRQRGLQRIVQAGPPDVNGPGWLVSEKSRRDLARLIGVGEERVSLAFYTPLPFAGTASARATLAMADDGLMPLLSGAARGPARPASYLMLAQFNPAAGMGGAPGAGEAGRAMSPPSRDAFPPGVFPGGGLGGNAAREAARNTGTWMRRDSGPLITVDPRSAGAVVIPGDNGAAIPELLRGSVPTIDTQRQVQTQVQAAASIAGLTAAARTATGGSIQAAGQVPVLRQALPDASMLMPLAPATASAPRIAPPLLAPDTAASPAPRTAMPDAAQHPPQAPAPPAILVPNAMPPALSRAPEMQLSPEPTGVPAGPPIAVPAPQRGLFGLAPAPFVQGDFVAALRLADGRWAVVQPASAPFPNSWQRRVLLWFAIALAVVAPFGWLFARRLVKPLDRFATAAEQLGRDPSVVIGPLDGPAEIGRAAFAFNLMQGRIRSFVDDRTAMIGAISHDLRTPLTRMRFRIEDVEADDVRDGLLEEVDAMEAMIAQVIDFIRDASNTSVRERLDLRTLVDDVVEDARLIGNDVTIERADAAPVEVDVLGMRRLLDNLLENAVKYGDRARIRLTTEAGTAVAEIIDDGPGLPDDEIERVFEPFYRSESARASDKSGSGLGLAVCRSIARAHGGDVRLVQAQGGFRAQIRVPLAYDRPVVA